ncbi:transposase [Sphingomonas sp. PWP1-2]|uniref:transposase n=1 Tax=Sphingomonas sp. PWP1-2 TaxID=2804558 RepID=UPI003CF83DE9
MGQVTIMSGVERRRMWTDEQKQALVIAAFQPGANVAEVARDADVRPSQIYRWRLQMFGAGKGFAAVTVHPEPSPPTGPVIVVELGSTIVRISADASPDLTAAVLRSLQR